MRVMLRSRERRAGGSADQAMMSPGMWSARMTARARPVSVTIRGFQPRVPASSAAMRRAWARAGPVMADATQWALSKCRDSPGAHSCSCVPVAGAGWRGRPAARAAGRGPVWPSRLIPANESCWQLTAAKSAGVILRRGAAAIPACSQHSRQCPFLIARIRWQPAIRPGGSGG